MPNCNLNSNIGEYCHTTDVESALNGTWVIDDFRLSLQKGFRILEVYEVTNIKSPDTTLKLGKGTVCKLHRRISEIESRGELLSRLGSKPGRQRTKYRFLLEVRGYG